MGHTICRGTGGVTWRHSKLGGNPDGSDGNDCRFHVDDHADAGKVAITGKHMSRGNTNLISGTCDGNFLNFAVADPTNENQLICYMKGKYSSAGSIDHINGKFSNPLQAPDALQDAGIRGTSHAAAADDWEADKTT